MSDEDYRTQKSDSVEGRHVAANRWADYEEQGVPDALDEMERLDLPIRPGRRHCLDPDDVATDAARLRADLSAEEIEEGEHRRADQLRRRRERMDLVGFWVNWHVAGGFRRLEELGWSRATIFRKVRRFRDLYGSHPDTYRFDWINLDVFAAWKAQTIAQFLDDPGDDNEHGSQIDRDDGPEEDV